MRRPSGVFFYPPTPKLRARTRWGDQRCVLQNALWLMALQSVVILLCAHHAWSNPSSVKITKRKKRHLFTSNWFMDFRSQWNNVCPRAVYRDMALVCPLTNWRYENGAGNYHGNILAFHNKPTVKRFAVQPVYEPVAACACLKLVVMRTSYYCHFNLKICCCFINYERIQIKKHNLK